MTSAHSQAARKLIEYFDKSLPHFKDGRIDYSYAREAAVLNVFVLYEGKVLLLKRSGRVRAYPHKWNSIGGYLDRVEPLWQSVVNELEEELGLDNALIETIHAGTPFSLYDEALDITWHIHPVRVTLLQEPEITLDWEHTDYRWIDPKEIEKYDTLPGLAHTYHMARG